MDVPPVPPDALTTPPIASAEAAGGLQFERADFGTAGTGTICAACHDAIAGEYYTVNGQTVCPRCKAQVDASLGTRPGAAGFLRAVAGGIAGGVAGALIYYAVLALTNYELAIIAIAVGWLVGKGVRWGTRGRGGPIYQALAIVITYMAIVSTYVPMVVQGLRDAQKAETGVTPPAPSEVASGTQMVVALVAVLVLAMVLPFLAGIQNLIGLAIIAIGLYEAWKINKRVTPVIAGPFHASVAPS